MLPRRCFTSGLVIYRLPEGSFACPLCRVCLGLDSDAPVVHLTSGACPKGCVHADAIFFQLGTNGEIYLGPQDSDLIRSGRARGPVRPFGESCILLGPARVELFGQGQTEYNSQTSRWER